MISLVALSPAQVAQRWAELIPFIADVADSSSGRHAPIDIFKALLGGDWHLWTAEHEDGKPVAILIARIVQFPRLRACELLAATGSEMTQWQDFIADIEEWARAQGCTLMQPVTRPGWERVLAKYGYRKTHVLLEKPL